MDAFARSLDAGFGIETDVRDLGGELVIAHDPPTRAAIPVEQLLELWASQAAELPLAINIKADGLQPLLSGALRRFNLRRYFVFDMSVPDMLSYLRAGLPVFTRQSDYEPSPVQYERAAGVWIDGFEDEWADAGTVAGHLDAGKQVCIVSPELHGRSPDAYWALIRTWPCVTSADLLICTDSPEAVGA